MPAREFDIGDLYPFEAAPKSGKVKKHVRTYENGGEPDPGLVLYVDEEWLVTDGCNRVYAAKLFGRETVYLRLDHKEEQEMRLYRDALQEAKDAGRKGFENFGAARAGSTGSEVSKDQHIDVDKLSEQLPEASDDSAT